MIQQRLSEFGFLTFTNFGFPIKEILDLYDSSRDFFSLDRETKLQYEGKVAGLNGYFRFESEKAVGAVAPDLKEFWHVIRPEVSPSSQVKYPENYWPSEISAFKDRALSLYKSMDLCAMKILKILEMTFSFPTNYFENVCKDGCSVLRIVHYPPLQDIKAAAQVRAAAHTGIQLIGLQAPATHPGLEFCLPNGAWIRLSEEFNECLTVNIGDMFEALSSRQAKATLHRVVNPSKDEINESRYAIVHFHHANPMAEIKPVLKNADPSFDFTPRLAHEWIRERITQISGGD